MAQLKDIKGRLGSVKSTQKITTAMMMVSSAKLQKSMKIVQNLSPYKHKLNQLLTHFLNHNEEVTSPLSQKRDVKRVAIIVFSSNTGLAGRFNDNVALKLKDVMQSYLHLGNENIIVYAVGGKVAKASRKMGYTTVDEYVEVSGRPTYEFAQSFSEKMTNMFIEGKVDKVEIIYHHFYSRGTQLVEREQFLPIDLSNNKNGEVSGDIEYIIEPDSKTILDQLLPKVLNVKMYTAHIDSVTSEHASRRMAMQIANDNADELIDELTLEYNKLRQESITNELLDILGGSFGKSGY
mgnify:CR=1 FL=1